jgi:8-oxo-dGTP pyrophosphatase MutT (NUDIX family)
MNYCVGLIFNEDLTRIILVKKNRGPQCVKDKLNGIGGKIEKDEAGDDAMIRECREETGLNLYNWNYFCELKCNEGIIYFYYIVLKDEIFYDYKQIEDEEIGHYWISSEYDHPTQGSHGDYKLLPHVANLDWLIPMAKNQIKQLDPTRVFIIKELF